MFAELHTHSDYSNIRLIDSTNKIENIIKTSKSLGEVACAITDHECLSGHIKALQASKKLEHKVILGNEIYLIDESDYQQTDKFWHFLLLAKDLEGHRQLRELSSRAWKRSYFHKRLERVPTFYNDLVEVIGDNKGHLIASTACLGGLFPAFVLNGELQRAVNFAKFCKTTFGEENFFIEIQPSSQPEQQLFNISAIQLCKENGFNWIITNDVHYLTQKDKDVHSAYLNSKDEERETGDFYSSTYFKTEDEMIVLLDNLYLEDIQKGFENTVKIANMVQSYDLKADTEVPCRKLPKFELNHTFKNWYDSYEYLRNFSNSEREQDKFFLHLVEQGFTEKRMSIFDEEKIARIDTEMKQLWKISETIHQPISAYYNLVQEIVDIMWADDGGDSFVGIARGSVTGYFTCYLIGITQINPLEWDIPWWRHLHESRPELPDVDLDSQASRRGQILFAMKLHYGEDNVLNVVTFKTESSKAATLTACRGFGIDNDIAQEIADYIPVERGQAWSISDCLFGNEENERKPIVEFIKKLEEYTGLRETILGIEGLVCGRGIHASGVNIYNNGYIEHNSLMKAPNGTYITCWNLADSEYCGNLKFDALTIEALDKERKTFDYLLEDGVIEWQGSLRATYNKYLHPDALEYNDSIMWEMIGKGEIVDLFQFSTMIGIESAKKIKPTNLKEMAFANSVMRLMSDGNISPMDKYVLHKNDISLWYKEMTDAKLTDEEILIIEKYLKPTYGIASEQEDIMLLSMDEKISNFTVKESNLLRKAVAKKKVKVLAEAKELFFNKGREAKTSDNMLNYVWDYCIMPQAGYAFSRNHTIPYSCIGLQELNLVHRYGSLYWNTACLSVNASAIDENDFDPDSEDDKSKSTDYGKIATAIGDMRSRGVLIELPDINNASFEFKPNKKNNSIIYGLKGIVSIGDDIVNMIITNRTYSSLEDFMKKCAIEPTKMIQLVKAGCFDNLENINRETIMNKYLTLLSRINIQAKDKLNMQNFPKIIELEMIPKELDIYRRKFNFRKYINQKDFLTNAYDSKGKPEQFHVLDNKAQVFFENEYLPTGVFAEGIDYFYDSMGDINLRNKSFEKIFKKEIEGIKTWLEDKKTLDKFNEMCYNVYIKELWNKYCAGNLSKWEMDSLSFYYHEHELANIDGFDNFFELPENPIVELTPEENKGYARYRLNRIIGTVLNRNKTRHTVTLLTPYGVVNVKFYAGQFINYDKQVSQANPDGSKTIVEKSWFSRGQKLVITGFRRGDQFVPRKYFNTIYQHTVSRIEDITPDNKLVLVTERKKGLESD